MWDYHQGRKWPFLFMFLSVSAQGAYVTIDHVQLPLARATADH